MKIRELTISDIEEIAALWAEAGLETRPSGRDSADELARHISENPDLCLGAEDGGSLIGCVIGSDDGRKGWFNRLAAKPARRREGVARALVEALEEALRKRGRHVFAATIYKENNASMELFRQAGFEVLDSVAYLRKSDGEDV